MLTESGGNPDADNGACHGLYQLTYDKLNGDYSVANQERAAEQYVASRYGSWEKAWAFHQANNWY